MLNLSKDFIEKKQQDATQAAEVYIRSLYQLLQCIDLSEPTGASKAHGILNMVESIQKMHSALEKQELSRGERKEAFKRSDVDAFTNFFTDGLARNWGSGEEK